MNTAAVSRQDALVGGVLAVLTRAIIRLGLDENMSARLRAIALEELERRLFELPN